MREAHARKREAGLIAVEYACVQCASSRGLVGHLVRSVDLCLVLDQHPHDGVVAIRGSLDEACVSALQGFTRENEKKKKEEKSDELGEV